MLEEFFGVVVFRGVWGGRFCLAFLGYLGAKADFLNGLPDAGGLDLGRIKLNGGPSGGKS